MPEVQDGHFRDHGPPFFYCFPDVSFAINSGEQVADFNELQVEIHGSRAVELQDLLGRCIFSSFHVCVAFRGLLQNTFFESSEMINFQKKVYQKRFICRGDM